MSLGFGVQSVSVRGVRWCWKHPGAHPDLQEPTPASTFTGLGFSRTLIALLSSCLFFAPVYLPGHLSRPGGCTVWAGSGLKVFVLVEIEPGLVQSRPVPVWVWGWLELDFDRPHLVHRHPSFLLYVKHPRQRAFREGLVAPNLGHPRNLLDEVAQRGHTVQLMVH